MIEAKYWGQIAERTFVFRFVILHKCFYCIFLSFVFLPFFSPLASFLSCSFWYQLYYLINE